MPTEVAIIAKYSPQRFSSHSPTASMISITAYAPAASASRVRVCGVSLNACWMRPSSLEWLTLKPSWRRNARSSGSALSYACSIDIRDAPNRQIAMARAPKMIARRTRSTANTRRISALRSSLPAPHPGCGRYRAAGGGLADDEGAAAQAAPGGTLAGADAQPLAEPGLIGREGDMAAGPAAQQAPVHVPSLAAPAGEGSARRSRRPRGHRAAPVALACGEASGSAV